MSSIWIDLTNTPHVNVLLPIIRKLEKKHEIIITARDFAETLPLLKKNGLNPIVIGEYKGKKKINKIFGMITRISELRREVPYFDISISLGGNYTASISKLRNKKSIIISDNDISYKGLSYRFGDYFIFPTYFDTKKLTDRYKIKQEKIFTYNGFKENIYIADYQPDKEFLKLLPFNEFITIRPENLKASYVPRNSSTIVPDLFKKFRDENILFLPRYKEEKQYANGYENIFIPKFPLNGLDVCFYSKAMLTGAGTFAREAALLGTPAISFFPGKTFLTVDKIMQEKGWEFKSRIADEIFDYVVSSSRNPSQIGESKIVQNEVQAIFDKLVV